MRWLIDRVDGIGDMLSRMDFAIAALSSGSSPPTSTLARSPLRMTLLEWRRRKGGKKGVGRLGNPEARRKGEGGRRWPGAEQSRCGAWIDGMGGGMFSPDPLVVRILF